ncbi:MAG: sigma-70 family RNA polymerase sigma factor [Planctomycetaceae bacterium]|nr:sigma-70 family RNA polymerase sigma factor [Planctomycetaceae bacterium]
MKIRISHPTLRGFFEQLRFAPTEQKTKQLAAAEQLLMMLNPEREYPYDFIVYRITGYRPRTDPSQPLIAGRDLLAALRVWIAQISDELELSISESQEPILTVADLARRFHVSTKTIRRWQKRGLNGRIYLFADGKKRLGFTQSAVGSFEATSAELIRKAAAFSQADAQQKQTIVQIAAALAAAKNYRTQFALVRDVASRTGRSCLTVRSILNAAGSNTAALPRSRGKLAGKEAALLYKLNQQGTGIGELMQKFKRSRSSVHRILNQQRARELFARRIEYVDSAEFAAPNASQLILEPSEAAGEAAKSSHLLSRPLEAELFRRYNYLKYCAVQELNRIQKDRPQSERLKRVVGLLQHADEVKTRIIEANMPLVINIAGKHLVGGFSMSELVSEGNMSLLAAVEKFDYTRGYRFSTYASWAIVKEFARIIPSEARRLDKAGGTDMTSLPVNLRIEHLPDISAVEQAQKDLRRIIENNLDEREQYVILNHYALDPSVIKKKPMTLKEIGDHLKLSKERTRQIELQALQKLRQSLSPEQFDLLTG